MKRKVAGRVAPPVVCAFCGHPLAPQKPRCMVVGDGGKIWGYYHAGCAEKLVLAHKGTGIQRELPGVEVGAVIPPAREETLPW